MQVHRNARTTPAIRQEMVRRVKEGHWKVTWAAAALGVSRTTVYKWLRRHREEGAGGLEDRRSRPARMPGRLPRVVVRWIERLRRQRWSGTAIARHLRLAISTVCGVLRRLGLNRWRSVCPREPVVRYERARAGELLHLDVKKLGRFWRPGHRVDGNRARHRRSRGARWEYLHVCVDDASRVAYVEALGDEKGKTAVGFLRRARRWYRARGVRVQEVMTDNGSGYVSRGFRQTCEELGLRHIRTRPYRPQTNGKAERFIQTLQREWAYGRPYQDSATRARALGPWLEHYNHRRPHGSLGGEAPFQRLRARL